MYVYLTMSSTVLWKHTHHFFKSSQLMQDPLFNPCLQFEGGGTERDSVGLTYSCCIILLPTFCCMPQCKPIINSPIWALSRYSTIHFWKEESSSIILSLISYGVNEFIIQMTICRWRVSWPCCSTVPWYADVFPSNPWCHFIPFLGFLWTPNRCSINELTIKWTNCAPATGLPDIEWRCSSLFLISGLNAISLSAIYRKIGCLLSAEERYTMVVYL